MRDLSDPKQRILCRRKRHERDGFHPAGLNGEPFVVHMSLLVNVRAFPVVYNAEKHTTLFDNTTILRRGSDIDRAVLTIVTHCSSTLC